ncbi:MAG: DUF3293 domain-containing protein [Gemmatimonadetes bacterium]|nr:DUF3293 domain-containing protein [Gemmatimonadota bacterium]
MSDAALLAAYRATAWTVEAPGGPLEVRFGHAAPAPLRPGGIVTAYNPASEPRAAEENRRADARLHARLAAAGVRAWRTLARGPDDPAGEWDEPGWCITGPARDLAISFGQEFGQNAIVWITEDGDVTLVTTRDGFCRTAVGEVIG